MASSDRRPALNLNFGGWLSVKCTEYLELREQNSVDSHILNLKMGALLFRVQKANVVTRFGLFRTNPALLCKGEYIVQARVPPPIFDAFVNMIEGGPITVSEENCDSLRLLADEFQFDELSAECNLCLAWRQPPSPDPLLAGRESVCQMIEIDAGHSVTIKLRRRSKTYYALISLAKIHDFADRLADAKENQIVIDGIEGSDHIVEKAIAAVYSNTATALPCDDTRKQHLALMMWEIHKIVYYRDINAVRYCLNRLNDIAPTGFDKARLLLLSQCDPLCPDDFVALPRADWKVIADSLALLRYEKNGNREDAREVLRKLETRDHYRSLLI
jgi:hypothetical protein